MIKRVLSLFLGMAMLLSLLVSCSSERIFNHCELYLTLSRDFEDVGSSDSFDLLLSNGDVSVGVARISFAAAYENGISDTLTDRAFADCDSLCALIFAAKDASIANSALSGSARASVIAPAGGAVERWANENGVEFIPAQ